MPHQKNLIVNDIHSQLNPTQVAEIVPVDSLAAIQATIRRAAEQGQVICVAGGRHAMGGQQFAAGALLLDTTRLNRILNFDPAAGLIEVEAGIQWPELIDYLVETQKGKPWSQQWGIAQKQTGADRISLGGSLAANGHGRGLKMPPMIGDVESFVVVDAKGEAHICSRQENSELFRLVIGGYGLFGIVYSVKLRLAPRQKVERVVEVITVDSLCAAFEGRIRAGFLYGDFQFSTDEQSKDFLRRGVFSCYRPVDPATPLPEGQTELSVDNWTHLFYLSHADKAEAFRRYAGFYLSTSGQIYGSDTHQLSTYLDNYHHNLDHRLGAAHPATEIITEIYVPRPDLPGFLAEVRDDFRANEVNLIYGTIRLIEADTESFLAWARQPYACTIFNLHTVHTPEGLAHSAAAFRRLIDMAIRRGGSYFLTYHKYAARRQVEACYPQFAEFLRLKRRYDPEERFQSDWYRYYRDMFGANFPTFSAAPLDTSFA
ncbi:MAG: FAD-binding oxidoreductase [Anaerolineales bacterium]|nr:FAD-binding oxidoreductase [Anaerolineales bacterium]